MGYEVYEYMGSVYVRDRVTKEIITELTNPAVLFMYDVDKPMRDQVIVLTKWGNRDVVSAEYNKRTSKALKAGLDLINNYFLADLPLDVDILNKVLNNPNHLKGLLNL